MKPTHFFDDIPLGPGSFVMLIEIDIGGFVSRHLVITSGVGL